MVTEFSGATAVVTGAASGIGYALSRELAARGARVYAADVNESALKRLEPECVACPLDVTDDAAVEALLNRVVDEHGRLDLLFNNAGIVMGGDFDAADLAQWRRIVDVNLWGVVHGSRHGYAIMRRQAGGGHIVNTSSSAGVMPVARSAAYAATKHAVVGLSTSLRQEGARHGVRISVVISGMVETGIFDAATNVGGYDYRRAVDRLPMRKLTPEDAALRILKGVERDREFIVFPLPNRIVTTLYRLMPTIVGRYAGKLT